jgi:NADH-quinone oxidoreductase subunit H
MPESETDLVGGFHTEYGAFKFGIFFVAEYSHMVIGSSLFILMFLGGWHVLPWARRPSAEGPAVVLARRRRVLLPRSCRSSCSSSSGCAGRIPRFRYDQVMRIGWRVLPARSPSLNLLAYFALVTPFRG